MQEFETFNSGVMEVCEVSKSTIVSTLGKFRFGDKTVGVTRFYEAKVAATQIDRAVSVPFNKNINKNNIVIIEDIQYKIEQVQYKMGTLPETLLITLTELAIKKRDERS